MIGSSHVRGYRLLTLPAASVIFLTCAPAQRAPAAPADASECGPGLTDAEVIASAKRALRVMWGQEPNLEHFRVRVQPVGCDYVFIAGQLDALSREDILIIVDRTGRVKTIPVCCDLGDCPEFCMPAENPAKPPDG